MASGCITKAISNFFKEVLIVFSIVLGKGSSIFLDYLDDTLLDSFSRLLRFELALLSIMRKN